MTKTIYYSIGGGGVLFYGTYIYAFLESRFTLDPNQTFEVHSSHKDFISGPRYIPGTHPHATGTCASPFSKKATTKNKQTISFVE